MTEHPISHRTETTSRDAKLKAIAAVFGDAVAARLAHAPAPPIPRQKDGPDTEADRIAWQTNRLIQHLRTQVGVGDPARPTHGATQSAPRPPMRGAAGPARIPLLVEGEDLAAEHPAVIAHILKDAPQQMRVAVLRALPGQVARAVMRRLR